MKCFKVEYEITKATLTAFVYSESEEGAKELTKNYQCRIESKDSSVTIETMELLNFVEVK